MAGRSAFARVKFHEQAKEDARKQGGENPMRIYAQVVSNSQNVVGLRSGSALVGLPSNGPLYISPSPPRRPESIIFSGHSGSSYDPRTSPIRRPQPLVLTSAIEKSEARVHVEGISTILRNTLGKMINVGEDGSIPSRTRPMVMTAGLSVHSPRTDPTPSVDCVPALSPSTSPETENFPKGSQDYSAEFEKYKGSFRRFQGGGKLPELDWTSLSNNPELWDVEGDTFVYLFSRGNKKRVPPAFRINSQVIINSGSVEFIDKLHHIVEPEGWPRFYPFDDQSASNLQSDQLFRPSSPFSEACEPASALHLTLSPASNVPRGTAGIRYEIYVPWPGMKEAGMLEVLWHVTTRNFFAILYNSSAIIGTTWYEAFVAVLKRIKSCPAYLAPGSSPVDWIVKYIMRHKFDDVRNNPSYAASLLAFSELPDVQWREGYIEAFVHSVGMFHLGQIDDVVEWQYVTPHTEIYISNAAMEIEDRIHRAQVWLASFDLTELWPASSAPPTSGRGCFDRLRKWLCNYYEGALGHWPPSTDKEEHIWLNYQTVQLLKNDFHTLYDYLVNRDIIFEQYPDRSGPKWRIVNKLNRSFRPDSSDTPLTDILVAFDDRNRFPHIPYPFPHTPDPISVQSKAKIAFRKTASPAKIQAESRKKARAYAEASNVYTLRDRCVNWDLLMSFIRFEQNDMLDNIDPFEARRGRWVLIYGILQVLATVSVDSPNLRYKEGSLYHLNPQMKGVVPWADPESAAEAQAVHTRSHCWTIPKTWPRTQLKVRKGSYQPIIWNGFGDGRDRVENTDTAVANGSHSDPDSPVASESIREVLSLGEMINPSSNDPLDATRPKRPYLTTSSTLQILNTSVSVEKG